MGNHLSGMSKLVLHSATAEISARENPIPSLLLSAIAWNHVQICPGYISETLLEAPFALVYNPLRSVWQQIVW